MAQQTAGAPRVAPVWARRPVPVGTIQAFDAWPVNWLFITWTTMEEPVRLDNDGQIVVALAKPRTGWKHATPRDSLRQGETRPTRPYQAVPRPHWWPVTVVRKGSLWQKQTRRAEVRWEGNFARAAGWTREEEGTRPGGACRQVRAPSEWR
jgi:hypothetical protein